MMDFDNFEASAPTRPLTQMDKAAAVLLAMGKPIAGKLLKFFTQSELQGIIASAQSLRSIPPHELEILVNEFEDLFTEGAGLMDNAKAIEGILEEGLTPTRLTACLAAAPPLPPMRPISGTGCRIPTRFLSPRAWARNMRRRSPMCCR